MNDQTLTFAMLSDTGLVRGHNEDACAADPHHGVFVVCDGVGGAASGEVASRMAADAVLAAMVSAQASRISPEMALRSALEHANQLVYRQARQNAAQRGMATTLVALVLEPPAEGAEGPSTIWLANVGDSRCYRVRPNHGGQGSPEPQGSLEQQGSFEQLTRDHSIVEEQVRSGEMTRAQANVSPIRNVITRAIGSDATVEPDLQHLPARTGDLYLLASDGLTRDLSDSEIFGILQAEHRTTSESLATLCKHLVQAANRRGGGDNITCLLVAIL